MTRRAYLTTLAVLLQVTIPAWADIASPATIAADERMEKNPNLYDEVDDYCDGKKPEAACTIPGDVFVGGGQGLCKRWVARNSSSIQMQCIRQGEVVRLEAVRAEGDTWLDDACVGKADNASCSVTLTYNGQRTTKASVCRTKTFVQQGMPYEAPRTIRETRCDTGDEQPAEHPLHRVGIMQKLFQ